nr:uncharacterized protein LOC109411521 isoform X7 [Aedes albopictus]
MPSLGWCLCFLALWHGQLIDASPNNGIMVTKESSLGTQETSPDSMPQNTPGSLEKSPDSMPQNTPRSQEKSATSSPHNSNWNSNKGKLLATTQVKVLKQNNSTWDTLGIATMKLFHNNTFQILLNESKQEGSSQYALDIRDVQNLQPPMMDSTSFPLTLGNETYNLQFSSYNESVIYHQIIKTAIQETTTIINQPSTQGPEHTVQLQNVNETASSTKKKHDEAHSSNTAVTSTHQYHICSISTANYDCQINKVHLIEAESHEFRHDPQKQRITFRDSVLRYLPKSLIDAFPNMEMLNLNGLKITDIEENAFENAGKLKELFLEDNRLQTFPVNVLYGARYLKKLILTANNITNIAYSFESNNLLHELFIDKNKINQLPSFENIPQLKTFNGTNNALDHIERINLLDKLNSKILTYPTTS